MCIRDRFDASFQDPPGDVAEKVGVVFFGEVVNDEPLHQNALTEYLPHGRSQTISSFSLFRPIVLRYQPAHGNPRELIQERKNSLPHCASDIFEIHIDPLWASGCKDGLKIR